MGDKARDEEAIFKIAAEIVSPETRKEYLQQACDGDVDLLDRVLVLLRALDEDTNFLESPPPGVAAATLASCITASPGTQIGPYKVAEQIGEGGMGTVFLAVQTEPVKRKVALKIIKPGMDSRQVVARFEAERQALAMMDHPNIARVLDAGTTGPASGCPGRPYFVMELVKGLPITRFCDERKLTTRQRLELFLPVCQAVQHAHQKGVIHRDLKPSNVLVALYDDQPVPKVIDFGVAKATGQSLSDLSLMTGFGAIVGTPEYMSPEQANLNNLDIDTRSDVYSLGVLLYELLTGTTPVDRKSLGQAAVLEILRIVREVEAPRPSTKLSTIEALPSVAANRGTEPAKLSKLMKGELDWVVLKALEKDRARRYDTANALARDIQRYLADEVVEARPPSAGYRLQKVIKRHKTQVVAASFVLFALVGGMLGATWGLLEARRSAKAERMAKEDAEAKKTLAEQNAQLAIAAAERERMATIDADIKRAEAETNLGYAIKGNEILGSVFEGLDPKASYATVAELRGALRDNLTKAINELEGSVIGDPLIVARMQTKLGMSLVSLGDGKLAIDILKQALETRKQQLGFDHPETLDSMSNLAAAQLDAGNLDLALPLFEETLKLRTAKFGSNDPHTLHAKSSLGEAYREAGKLDQARTLLSEVYEIGKTTFRPDDSRLLVFTAQLASLYRDCGKPDLALPLYEEAHRLSKAQLRPDHPYALAAMNNLALAYREAGKLQLATPLLEQALKSQRSKLGSDHPITISSMGNLARAYEEAGKPDLAIPLVEELLRVYKTKVGPNHADTLNSMGDLARLYADTGKLDLAVPLLEETLRLRKAGLGPDHPDTSRTMINLAMLYRNAGKLDLAVPLGEQAHALQKATLGLDHLDTLRGMQTLASTYLVAGQRDRGLALFEQAVEVATAKFGRDHPETLTIITKLASAYSDAGLQERALPLVEESLKLRKATLGPEHPDTLRSLANLAAIYWKLKRFDRSIPLFEEAVRLQEQSLGRNHEITLLTVMRLGLNYQDAGRYKEAVPLLEEAFRGRRKQLGSDHPDSLSLMNSVGVACWQSGQLDKSIPLFEELLRLQETKLGRNHVATLTTVANLGVNYKDANRIEDAIQLLEEAHGAVPKHAELGWVVEPLIDAYTRAGHTTKLVLLLREQLTSARRELPEDSSQLANVLAQFSSTLLAHKQWADAEPLLRECLAIRQKQEPGDWRTFNTQSMLGGALLGQKKYAEAEPLLSTGYEGLKQRETMIPPQGVIRLPEAVDRLIVLYTATDKPDEVKKWRAERAKYRQGKSPDEKQ